MKALEGNTITDKINNGLYGRLFDELEVHLALGSQHKLALRIENNLYIRLFARIRQKV